MTNPNQVPNNAANQAQPNAAPAAGDRVIHPDRRRRVQTALTAFSVTAYITGVMLLVLVAEMIYKYGILEDKNDAPSWFFFVAQVHGFAYMAFLIAIVNLGTKARWTPGKWIITALGGVVPFLSFIVERKRRDEVRAEFDLA
ncbi:integral membrane protein [Corynebacterium freneyi]|uniref:Integral membrane protein n=1 Tax=Corynebacterium freneyi TaxID=134034 RepID=A0ABS4U9P1_9CORY|nr:integral membrane protein [Corynebacterium freneyi]WJZ04647.1 hypothetical protein CFREN_03315 [Corynebacterium freneyi]